MKNELTPFIFYGEAYNLVLRYTTYYSNNSLAVLAECDNELFGDITTNLPLFSDCLPKDCAFVDTNNLPNIDKWLKENNLAEPMGVWRSSGYCTYQLFRFLNV